MSTAAMGKKMLMILLLLVPPQILVMMLVTRLVPATPWPRDPSPSSSWSSSAKRPRRGQQRDPLTRQLPEPIDVTRPLPLLAVPGSPVATAS
jgi:hypothetical protein